jgi:hypothetical protein
MADISLSTLRQRVGRLMGTMHTATPSGNFAVNGTDTTELAVFVDDYFNDWHGRFYAGPNRDTNFEVTVFVKSLGHITFLPAATAVVAQDLLELHQDFTPIEINDAINIAISIVETEALLDIVDESIEVKSAVFEYAIPSGIYSIDHIYQEQDTEDRYSPSANLIDRRYWRVLHGSPSMLWFNDSYVTLTANRNLRIVGQKLQPQLVFDDDLCSINQSFIIYQAKALLHQSRIRGEGSGFEGHTTQMSMAQRRASEERLGIRVAMQGMRV